MIQAVPDGQYDIGMDGITINDERKAEGRFLRPLYALGAVHAGARRREAASPTPRAFGAVKDLLVGAQAGTTHFYTAVYSVLDGNETEPAHQAVRDLRRHRCRR